MVNIPMMDSYLESLAGYICDDDKLVTYKWLSKELEVHVNVAKIILWRYWEKCKNDQLVATFMLIGDLKSGGMRVEVVRDTDLSRAREKFEKIISEHVYSLQKTLIDIEILAGSGKGDSRYSAIKCDKSVILSDEELSTMRWGKARAPEAATEDKKSAASEKKSVLSNEKKVAQTVPTKKDTSREKDATKTMDQSTSEIETKNDEKPAKKITPTAKTKANEKKGAIPKKPVQSTKTGYGNLFGKAANQLKTQRANTAIETGKNIAKESDSSLEQKASKPTIDNSLEKAETAKKEKSSNLSVKDERRNLNDKSLNFSRKDEISKENEESSSETRKDVKKKENDKISNVSKKNFSESPLNREISSNNDDKTSRKIVKSTSDKKSVGKKDKKISRGKKRDRSRDSEPETKKRKRIVEVFDSSEDSAVPSDEEDMFESPPRREPAEIVEKSPSPPLIRREGNKRKVRKLVDKTFVDDDGFLITKKTQVYESCSEEEIDIIETKKNIEPEVPKETKVNVKKKQLTLNNFFKKA